jgi:hypothetical protein
MNSQAQQAMPLRGSYYIEHRNAAGKLIGLYRVPNGIVDVGMNDLLDVAFGADTQHTAWYIGLIDNSGYTGVSDSDTLSSHAGWSEATPYSGNRVAWSVGAASSRSISNGTTADFSITGSATLKGIFVTDQASGTSGILWSTALFSSTVTVAASDTLKITYTVSG